MKEFQDYVTEAEVLFNKCFVTSIDESFTVYQWTTGETKEVEEPTYLILKALIKLKKH